ncbi:MAG TPA: ATP-binding protein [Sphingomicrobium sp.]|nr:ATP-binding protein [Sphingomicrobium sp.]
MSTSSTNRDREILEAIPVSVCAFDLNLVMTFWNAAAERLYGWSRDEAIGNKGTDLFRRPYDERIRTSMELLISTGTLERRVYRHAKDGSLLVVDANWAVRRDARGASIEIVESSHLTDPSELAIDSSGALMAAYQALAESEKKYRDLFNFMPIAIWQLDSRKMGNMFKDLRAAGVDDLAGYVTEHPEFLDEAQATLKITEANEQALCLFGATDREQLLEAMPGLWLPRGEDWVGARKARESGAMSYSMESTIRRMDGSTADVMFSVAFANEDDPKSLNTVGAIDITEEKRAKEALERSERKYRTLLQYMPIALVQIDVRELLEIFTKLRRDGVDDLDAYIDANPEFLEHAMQIIRVEEGNDLTCQLFGARDSAELSGPVDRFFKERPDTLKRSLAARYAGRERFMEETRLSTLDGRILDLLYTSAFTLELSEFGVGLVGMIDIGDRLHAERSLQQIQAEVAHAARVATLGELAASIAHEVNQPLTAISVNGEASLRWLDREPPDIGEVRIVAARIVADARRAADIVARIRNMASHKDPQRDPVDLGEVVQETFNFLHREIQTQGIRLNLHLAEKLPLVLGDRTQLQQVVLNLVLNAMHAVRNQRPDRRQLTVRVEDNGNRVRVEIEDLGPGIAEDDRARMFDAFFTTKADGLGLGLSICRSIIDYHGGEIDCEHLAVGTRFAFSVPVAEPIASLTKQVKTT